MRSRASEEGIPGSVSGGEVTVHDIFGSWVADDKRAEGRGGMMRAFGVEGRPLDARNHSFMWTL